MATLEDIKDILFKNEKRAPQKFIIQQLNKFLIISILTM
jgi:hypothetical protein